MLEILEMLHDAIAHREENPELDERLKWSESHRPVVWEDGQWRLGGFINYFQQTWDVLKAVDPSLPNALPRHLLDPEQISRFFGIPVEDFDWPGEAQLPRMERKLDALLKVGGNPETRALANVWKATTPATIQFAYSRKICRITFKKGELFEEAEFVSVWGFKCWEVLISRPGYAFDPIELERESRLPPPKKGRGVYLAASGRIDADADSRKAALEADDEGCGVLLDKTGDDENTGKRTIKDLRKQLEREEEELARTVNPERRQELEAVIAELRSWQGKVMNKKGEPRPLSSSAKELARKRIRNLLDRARSDIGTKMPFLARYLAATEEAFLYDPDRSI